MTPLGAALTWAAVVCEFSSWTTCSLCWLFYCLLSYFWPIICTSAATYHLWRPVLSHWGNLLCFLVQHISLEFKVELWHTVFCSTQVFYFLSQFSADMKGDWRVYWTWIVISVSMSQKEGLFATYLLKSWWRLGSVADAMAMWWSDENGPYKHIRSGSVGGVALLE